MLGLGCQDEKAAEAAAAMDVDEDTTPSNAAAQPKADEEKAGGKLHVLGIGGRRAKRGSSKATGTKKTPGEIRIQKGEGCAAKRLQGDLRGLKSSRVAGCSILVV